MTGMLFGEAALAIKPNIAPATVIRTAPRTTGANLGRLFNAASIRLYRTQHTDANNRRPLQVCSDLNGIEHLARRSSITFY